MAGYLEDPTQWRLRTLVNNIPYKLLSAEGSFEHVSAAMDIKVLIHTSDLIAFCSELFPAPFMFGAISIPQYVRFGNIGNLVAKSVSFKGFDSGLPTDPTQVDPGAPIGTYFPTLELTIHLSTAPQGSPTNPVTYLEVSADASGEYIHVPPANTTLQSLNPDGTPNTTEPPRRNRVPILPHTIMVPQTMWSLKWPRIPFFVFRDGIRPRLELALGKVNSEAFSLLYANFPETLLFAGYTYSFAFTWKPGSDDAPFINLDMKFLEKRVLWRGLIRGHQDVWRPGSGWDRLLINGQPSYEAVDFNTIFNP
jgi:hypothetical protein